MRSIRMLIAAVALTALTLVPTSPAGAHGGYPHWQWRWSGCVAGLSWAYGDAQESYSNSADAWHNHAWSRYGVMLRTEGDLQVQWAITGWECGYVGNPTNNQQSWLDGGRLVKRQFFSGRTIQIVYRTTSGCGCGGYDTAVY